MDGMTLLVLVFLVALLYSSVGHGGASGYLAVLALFGFAPPLMKTSALVLNLAVAGAAFAAYRGAGHFQWRLFWPFAASSIPLAFLGGRLRVSPELYCGLLALTLAFASWRMLVFSEKGPRAHERPALPVCLGLGGLIGLLSGIVGVGGGIFLSPLMILLGWSNAKRAAAVSALFIWVNSLSGLAGHLSKGAAVPADVWPLAASAVVGGLIGSRMGAVHWGELTLRRALAAVLGFACVKLVRTAFHV